MPSVSCTAPGRYVVTPVTRSRRSAMTRHTLILAGLAIAPGGVAIPPAAHAAAAPTLRVAGSRYGPILVERGGRTLYLFTRETGRASRCSGACARAWPPALVHGRLRAGHGIRRSLMGTIGRRDGGRQLTYAGHPLYRYAPETRAGQILCQNVTEFGGVWLVVNPDGRPNRSPR
jgi:predicted lipoprotein with Yx(FWY)xxD motif